MKRALLTLAIGITALSVTASAQLPASVKTLVEAERAFAAAATAKGQRDAFLEYLADDSLLFRPGPVPGKMFYRTRPVPPGQLSWGPVFADASLAGDYGVSTGPFEFRKDPKQTDPPNGYGHFVSIWKKQRDGVWKVEVDLGVSHDKFPKAVADLKDADIATPPVQAAPPPLKPAPTAASTPPASASPAAARSGADKAATAKPADAAKPADSVKPAEGAKPADAKPGAADPKASVPPPSPSSLAPAPKPVDPLVQSLIDADKAFAKAATEQGLLKAYQAVAMNDLRILRNGQLPTVGKVEIEKALGAAASSKTANWEPVHTRAATSGDFGYTTGAYAATANAGANPMAAGAPPTRQYYVHVWRRGADGAWKLLLDIIV